jgi:hypothetical protein
MRFVKVPPEMVIPFLFMLAMIAFTGHHQIAGCLYPPFSGHLWNVCLAP